MKLYRGQKSEEATREIGMFLGAVLRIGVWAASIVAIIGGVLYLIQSGNLTTDYSPPKEAGEVFEGTAEYLRNFKGIFSGVSQLNGAAIIQFGVIILIATPIIRVAISVFTFAYERDLMYVIITLVVLFIIIANMIFGFH